MYRWIVSPASAKLVASELRRADQQAFRAPSPAPSRAAVESARFAREATRTVLPVTGHATRRPRRILRALRLAH
jgi:hypothetical protein